jgi:hypothetical protein
LTPKPDGFVYASTVMLAYNHQILEYLIFVEL